jgi:hypothetical protein
LELVIGRVSDSIDLDKRGQTVPDDREYFVSHVLPWLWDGDNLGTQEGERPLLEAGTQILVRDSGPIGLSVL